MRPCPDLHPDDLAARVELRARLWQLRQDSGLSAQQVGRESGFSFPGAVRSLENSTNWEVRRAQRWARGLNHRLVLDIEGVEVAADDTTSLIWRAATTFGALDEDEMHLRLAADDLRRTRVERGLSRVEFAVRCGVSEGGVRLFENNPLRSLLRTYQRYTRALGGSLGLRLEPVGVMAA